MTSLQRPRASLNRRACSFTFTLRLNEVVKKRRVGVLQCLDAEMLQIFHCDDAKTDNPEVTSYMLGRTLGEDLDERCENASP